jgi:hypothetical protein
MCSVPWPKNGWTRVHRHCDRGGLSGRVPLGGAANPGPPGAYPAHPRPGPDGIFEHKPWGPAARIDRRTTDAPRSTATGVPRARCLMACTPPPQSRVAAGACPLSDVLPWRARLSRIRPGSHRSPSRANDGLPPATPLRSRLDRQHRRVSDAARANRAGRCHPGRPRSRPAAVHLPSGTHRSVGGQADHSPSGVAGGGVPNG